MQTYVSDMIERDISASVLDAAARYPVVTITGPRQSGKTTLCRALFGERPGVSLEDPDEAAFARGDPRGFLAQFEDGAFIDEVQRVPELLSYLQGVVDRDPRPGRFILTGSQNLNLIQNVSQSLAGRTALLRLLPCALGEVRAFDVFPSDLASTLLHGGYPRIFDQKIPPRLWFKDYVATYLERDVRQVLNVGDLVAFQTFLGLCAGRSGQLLNLSALGGDAGVTHATAKAWVSVLEASFVAIRLRPYHRNINKRLIKTPKLHFLDSGLLCYLLGIETAEQLSRHPLRGAIFETWVTAEVLKSRWNSNATGSVFFYRDQRGHEVDLVIEEAGHVRGIECKSGQTIAADFFVPLETFGALASADAAVLGYEAAVVYGGERAEQRSAGRVVPWSEMHEHPWTRWWHR